MISGNPMAAALVQAGGPQLPVDVRDRAQDVVCAAWVGCRVDGPGAFLPLKDQVAVALDQRLAAALRVSASAAAETWLSVAVLAWEGPLARPLPLQPGIWSPREP